MNIKSVRDFPLEHGKRWIVALFRYALLIGLGFIIIYPFLTKISTMFMSESDLKDAMVWMIPKSPTLGNVVHVLEYGNFWSALLNTAIISVGCAVLQTISCTLVGYGLARFSFKGRAVIFALMVFTIVVPPSTINTALYMKFRFLDFFGLLSNLGVKVPSLIDTVFPLFLLSITALGLKNGLYILVMWQRFQGVSKELTEAAFVDGAGQWKTFLYVIMPQAKAMMVSIFMLGIAWQWTDTFYSSLFFHQTTVLPNIISMVATANYGISNANVMYVNAALIMTILPLFLLYLFTQRFLIKGVEQSGLVG